MAVTVAATAWVDAGPDQIVCEGTTIVNLVGHVGGAIGENKKNEWDWIALDGGSIGQDKLITTYEYPNPGLTPGVYRAVLKSNVSAVGCNQVSDTIFITVLANPTANAGGPDAACQSASPSAITLAGASVGGGATTGAWSIITGGGTLSSTAQTATPATVTYTPAANYSGTVTLRLTTNAPGNCSAVFADRTITVNPAPTVNAGGPDDACESSSPAAITLTGASVGGGATTGAWSIVSGGGSLSSTAQTATPATVTYTPAANYSGPVTLRLTTNAPGTCSAVSADRTITVNPAPTVNAGGPDEACESASPAAIILTGASVGGGATTGAWSIVSGGGTLSSTAQTATPATVTYTPAANFNGTVTLRLTTDAPGTCSAATADRIINVNPAPTVNAGGPDDICESASPSPITLTGASVGGGATTGAWSIISGGGTLSSLAQTATPETVTYTPAANFSGTVTLRLTTDAPGTCSAATADRIINVNPEPTVNAGGPDEACESSSPAAITLTGASVGGSATTGAWSIISGGGTLSSTAQTATPATVTYTPQADWSGTVTLRLTTDAPGTCSAATADRTITVNEAVIVDAGPNDTICQGNFVALAGSISGGIGTGAWVGGAGTFNPNRNTLNATYTPSGAEIAAGTVKLTLTSGDPAGPCGPVSDTMRITIYKAVVITTQPLNTGACVGDAVDFTVAAVGTGLTYQWYKGVAPGGTAITNGANISGAMSATLHFNSVSLSRRWIILCNCYWHIAMLTGNIPVP